jgi:hypothetical protein
MKMHFSDMVFTKKRKLEIRFNSGQERIFFQFVRGNTKLSLFLSLFLALLKFLKTDQRNLRTFC